MKNRLRVLPVQNIITLLLLIGFAQTIVIYAQDAHYWTNQYGTKAQLLGGMVVGSVKDLSSVYYNPGALPSIKDSTMVLTTAAFEVNYFRWEDVLGTGKKLDYLQAKPAPIIFAVRARLGGLKRSNWVISYLTRHDFEINLEGRRAVQPSSTAGVSGEEYTQFDEIRFHERITEGWMGVTWAYKYNSRISLGVTEFFALRNQRTRSQNIWQKAIPDSGNESRLYIDEFSFWAVRTFWKIGLFVDYTPLTLGITFTTPGFHIMGNGWSFLASSRLSSEGWIPAFQSEIGAYYQESMITRYHSSGYIALGASYRVRNAQIHITGEWFNKIPLYPVLKSANGENHPEVMHELSSVFNWGVAAEHKLSHRFTLYSGFIVDRSAYIPGSESRLSMTSWDLYHFSLGSAFFVWNSYFTLGFSYSYGGEKLKTPGYFDTRMENSMGSDVREIGKVITHRLKILLGLSMRF